MKGVIQQVSRDTGHPGCCHGGRRSYKTGYNSIASPRSRKASVVHEYFISYQALPWETPAQIKYHLLGTKSSLLGEALTSRCVTLECLGNNFRNLLLKGTYSSRSTEYLLSSLGRVFSPPTKTTTWRRRRGCCLLY